MVHRRKLKSMHVVVRLIMSRLMSRLLRLDLLQVERLVALFPHFHLFAHVSRLVGYGSGGRVGKKYFWWFLLLFHVGEDGVFLLEPGVKLLDEVVVDDVAFFNVVADLFF